MQDFRQIRAWQRAHALAIAIHQICRGFGRVGHSHLRSQLTRAAESIATNIVEGCGAASAREFGRYLDISIKSANETEHHLLSARAFKLISGDDWQRLTSETVEIRKMTYGYRKRVLSNDRSATPSRLTPRP